MIPKSMYVPLTYSLVLDVKIILPDVLKEPSSICSVEK